MYLRVLQRNVRTVEIEVRRVDGWETVTFEEIETLGVYGSPGEDGVQFTLIGEREDGPNLHRTGILDVAERHRPLLDSPLPTTDDGTAVPVAVRRK